MSQISFSDAEQAGKRKKTRREVFLGEMEVVVPWKALLKVIEPHYPVAGRGRRPYPLEAMLRVHLMQNWFALSDPAMEEALYEIASLRTFAELDLAAIPDETTILNFRHLLEANDLAEDILKTVNAHLARKGLLLKRGSIVDATIIAAPSSTKNSKPERDPEMHQTRKGKPWYFGMKRHSGLDRPSGLTPSAVVTPATGHDNHPGPTGGTGRKGGSTATAPTPAKRSCYRVTPRRLRTSRIRARANPEKSTRLRAARTATNRKSDPGSSTALPVSSACGDLPRSALAAGPRMPRAHSPRWPWRIFICRAGICWHRGAPSGRKAGRKTRKRSARTKKNGLNAENYRLKTVSGSLRLAQSRNFPPGRKTDACSAEP